MPDHVARSPRSAIENNRPVPAGMQIGRSWMRDLQLRPFMAPGKTSLPSENPSKLPASTYDEMEADSGVIFPHMIKAYVIRRAKWTVECDNAQAKEALEKNLSEWWSAFARDMTRALQYGWAPFEKRLDTTTTPWTWKKPVPLRPHNMKILTDEDGSFAGLIQQQGMQTVTIPPEKSFVFTNDPKFGNIYGRSDFTPAYRAYYLDRFAFDYHGIFLETRAIQPTVGYAPEGQTKVGEEEDGTPIMQNNLELMQEVMSPESLRAGGGVVLPSGTGGPNTDRWRARMMETGSDQLNFPATHDLLDMRKARAMGVPDEITKGGSGSLAKAIEQGDFFLLLMEGHLEDIAGHVTEFLVKPLARWNWGEIEARFKFQPLRDEDKILFQHLLELFANEGTREFGIDFVAMLDQMDVPLLKGKDEQPEQEVAPVEMDMEMKKAVVLNVWRQFLTAKALGLPVSKKEAYEKLELLVPAGEADVLEMPTGGQAQFERAVLADQLRLARSDSKLPQMLPGVKVGGMKSWLAKAEAAYIASVEAVLDKMAGRLSAQVRRAVDSPKSTSSILREMGPSFVSEYKTTVAVQIEAAYTFGIESGRRELDVQGAVGMSADLKQDILLRAETLAEQHSTELISAARLAALGAQNNAPPDAVIGAATSAMQGRINRIVSTSPRTELQQAFNQGREKVASLYAAGRIS